MTDEKRLEARLTREVKKLGGISLKLEGRTHAGKFDRLLIMPNGVTWFVELKTPGNGLSPLQKVFERGLHVRRQNFASIETDADLEKLTEDIKTQINERR